MGSVTAVVGNGFYSSVQAGSHCAAWLALPPTCWDSQCAILGLLTDKRGCNSQQTFDVFCEILRDTKKYILHKKCAKLHVKVSVVLKPLIQKLRKDVYT